MGKNIRQKSFGVIKVKSVRISSPVKGFLQIKCLVENILKTMLISCVPWLVYGKVVNDSLK